MPCKLLISLTSVSYTHLDVYKRQGVVATHCDEVAVVYGGNIIEYGSREQIFDHPSHPYTIGLFGAIPNMNEDEEWLHPIDGLPPDPANLPEGCSFHPRCKYATEECRHGVTGMQTTSDGHECRCCHVDTVLRGEDVYKRQVISFDCSQFLFR